MREILIKSLKHNTATTVILAVVCVGLIGLLGFQNIQYHKALVQQTEKYTELMITQQPDIQDFPNRKLGRFTLSWYSPKELGKEKASQLRLFVVHKIDIYEKNKF